MDGGGELVAAPVVAIADSDDNRRIVAFFVALGRRHDSVLDSFGG